MPSVIVLTGPTCSGKSALALRWAEEQNGVIINADAMQTYRDLCIITARPTQEDMARAPHRLYGILDATDMCTAARWIEMAAAEIRKVWDEGKKPIVVGGTGMYLKCLMEGMSEVPAIPQDVREAVRAKASEKRLSDGLHAYLASIDPLMAARLKPGDTQRILRAAEVMLATRRSLAEWQEAPSDPPLPEATFEVFALSPPRAELYARINARFEAMIEEGAVEEVRRLQGALSNTAHPASESALPILRAHGVPEILNYLNGNVTLEEAMNKARKNTRHYAKRQWTWLRNQFPEAQQVLL